MRQSVSKVIPHLAQPAFWRAAVSWKPFSLTSYAMCQRMKLTVPELDAIFDFGANVGQFSRAAIETWSPDLLVAVEPNPAAASELRKNLDGVVVEQVGVGAKPGRATLHITRNSVSSSLLRPTTPHPGLDTLQHVEVATTTVDDLFERHGPARPSTLLKFDVQGLELEALRGARNTLPRASHLLIESSLQPSYAGEPAVDDVLSFVHSQTSYRLLDVVDTLRTESGHPWQVDLLFHRTNTP